MAFGKINKSKRLEKEPGKTSRWKKFAMALSIAGLLASCDGHYSYNNGEFEENPDLSESKNVIPTETEKYGTGYIVKINGEDKYKVGSLKEAEDKICELISDENEGYVHDRYIKKALKKTARFTEKYDEYQNNPNRPKKRTVSLKDGK